MGMIIPHLRMIFLPGAYVETPKFRFFGSVALAYAMPSNRKRLQTLQTISHWWDTASRICMTLQTQYILNSIL